MIRFALPLALLIAAAPANAGIGAQIGYSSGRDVYLMNPDGSGTRLLYRGAVGAQIFAISMKKDGGELSFEEVAKNGSSSKLITLTYGSSGTGQVTRSIVGCRWDVSTRSDGAILAVNICSPKVKFAAAGSSTVTDLATTGTASKAAWMSDGTFIYAANGTIWHGSLSDPAGTQIATQDCVLSLNPAHWDSEALISVADCTGGPTIDRIQVPSGARTSVALGPDAAYSQDDRCFIFVTPTQRRKSNFLLMARTDGSGSSVQIGRGGSYGSVDWRGDSSPGSCPIITADALRFREVK